jgi:hypothetical protein
MRKEECLHSALASLGFFFTSEAKPSFSRVGKPPKFAISVEKYLLIVADLLPVLVSAV